MTIVLKSKPGLSSATALSIPKDWDSAWFRGFISNMLKGGDVRNAISGTGITVSGTIASPYATISAGNSGSVGTTDTFLRGDGNWSNTLVGNGTTAALIVTNTSAQSAGFFSTNGAQIADGATYALNVRALHNGFRIHAGTSGTAGDIPFVVTDNGDSINYLVINGQGNALFNSTTLGTLAVQGAQGGVGSTGAGWVPAIASYLVGQPGASGGFKNGFGGNISWDGSNWRTGTDGGSNGGFFIGAIYNTNTINFYTVPSTGGTNQTISNSALDGAIRVQMSDSVIQIFMNAASYGTAYTAVAGLQMTNASVTAQMAMDMNIPNATGGAARGRIRLDYQGSMNYVAAGFGGTYNGQHAFWCGGDAGVGAVRMQIGNDGILSLPTVPITATATAGGGSGIPATTLGFIQVRINGTVRNIPFYA